MICVQKVCSATTSSGAYSLTISNTQKVKQGFFYSIASENYPQKRQSMLNLLCKEKTMLELWTLLPDELKVFLLAMLPLTELRAAIPIGIAVHEFSVWKAFLLGVSGNILISLILIHFLEPVSKIMRKHSKFMDRFFIKLFDKTRKKHTHKISEIGHIALILFVAVPLPGSGGWTGSLISYVFGVNKNLSMFLVSIGLVLSGLVVAWGTEGVVLLFS